MTSAYRGRRLVAVPAAIAALTVFAVWGSSPSVGASRATAASSPSTVVAAARALYKQYTAKQPQIVIPVLPRKPPSGISITITTCQLPVCATETTAARAAAKSLGWKVSYLEEPLSPAGYQTTLDQVVQSPPKVAAITPVVPNSFVSKQLAALVAHGVKIAEMAPAGDLPSAAGPVLAAVVGPPQFAASGQLMADAVVANAGGAASTVFITDPSLAAIWSPIQAGFTKVIQGAGGSVGVLQVSSLNIGKTIPSQVVSYVQAHPDVKYLAFALSDLDAGVPQALASAGLSKNVKIVSRAPQAANLANIKAGAEWASVGEENSTGGYRVIDQLARLLEGVRLSASLRDPAGWHQIYVKNNVTQTSEAPPTPGFPQVFLKAWHLK